MEQRSGPPVVHIVVDGAVDWTEHAPSDEFSAEQYPMPPYAEQAEFAAEAEHHDVELPPVPIEHIPVLPVFAEQVLFAVSAEHRFWLPLDSPLTLHVLCGVSPEFDEHLVVVPLVEHADCCELPLTEHCVVVVSVEPVEQL